MAIKYEIHYLPNAGGNEETRRFAHIFEQPAMTDKADDRTNSPT